MYITNNKQIYSVFNQKTECINKLEVMQNNSILKMEKKEIIKEIVESSGDITGSIGGAVLGTLIAGPAGLVLGGASGVIITKLFKKIGNEIQERILSSREEIRIGAAYTFAINKINENLSDGKLIRNDGFFEPEKGRSLSEEILEGIILTAQKEHEERKVIFLGNLYGNICTDSSISSDQANQLIKITNALTYRQFCLLYLYNTRKEQNIHSTTYNNPSDKRIIPFDIIAEVKDLTQKGLLHTVTSFASLDGFNCRSFSVTSGGRFYFKVLELEQIDKKEVEKINQIVNIISSVVTNS